jgi:DNA polymerase I-like protein with 3'-5' exonuclease and polymerase domains
MLKPDSCKQCPRYGDGKGFVPDTLRVASTVMVLQMAPSVCDARGERTVGYDGKVPIIEKGMPAPFLGHTGYTLRQTYAPLMKVPEMSVSWGSLIKCRDEGSTEDIDYCTQHHLSFPSSVRVIVAHGGEVFGYLQASLKSSRKGEHSTGGLITAWRGFTGPDTYRGVSVFAVQDVQTFYTDPTMRVPARLDWLRIGKFLRGVWPDAIPSRIVVGVSASSYDSWIDAAQAKFMAIDTEFNRDTKFLTMCGVGWVRQDGTVGGVQIQWVGDPDVTTEGRKEFMAGFRHVVSCVPAVFHNAKADIPVLQHAFGIAYDDYLRIEDTMQAHACLWSEMPHSLDFCASVYGRYTKLKHLEGADQLLYNWGDVIETLSTWEALQGELAALPSVQKVYLEQNMTLLPIILQREAIGLRVDQPTVQSLMTDYTAKVCRFDAIAAAYAGYPLNLNSSGGTGQLARHLLAYEGLDLASVDNATIAEMRDAFLPFDRTYEEQQGFSEAYLEDRIRQGARPLLELRAARVYYGHALSQDLTPLVGVDKVHPTYSIHAQESGRWSTTKPAMAKVPVEFLKLFPPRPGHILFGFDWDAQEPRIFMAEAKSEYLRKAFDEKLDIHTMLCCDMFGWPKPPNLQNPHTSPECAEWRALVGWKGKEDTRRTVAKNVRYERYYMGSGYRAIAKAVKVGISRQAMEKASALVMMQDPNVAAFHRMILKQAQAGRVFTWAGRLRVSLGQGKAVAREMCNQKMQGGGADLLNLTLIEAYEKHPDALFAYTRHDSIMWEIPVTAFTHDLAHSLKTIVEQPRLINGVMVKFPATFKTMDEHGITAPYAP